MRLVCCFVVCCALLGACQPSGDPAARGEPTPVERATAQGPRLGAPGRGQVPQSIAELLARGDEAAVAWQDDPRVAEIAVTLAQDRWDTARALYVAPDADRYLDVRIDGDGFAVQRVTLAGTLEIEAVPAAGIEQVPGLPDATLDPAPLADAASGAMVECGAATDVADVLYASGAPFTWDPAAGVWQQPPAWTATLTDDTGAGVTVDPVSGEPAGDDPCLAP